MYLFRRRSHLFMSISCNSKRYVFLAASPEEHSSLSGPVVSILPQISSAGPNVLYFAPSFCPMVSEQMCSIIMSVQRDLANHPFTLVRKTDKSQHEMRALEPTLKAQAKYSVPSPTGSVIRSSFAASSRATPVS